MTSGHQQNGANMVECSSLQHQHPSQDPQQHDHHNESQEQSQHQEERLVVISSSSRRSSLTCTSRRRSSLASTSTYGDESCGAANNDGEEGNRRPRRRRNSSVTFGEVRVREHEIVLGNHPCCKTGFPIELGWKYYEQETVMRLEQMSAFTENNTNQNDAEEEESSSGQRRGINNSSSNISLLDFEEPAAGRVPIIKKTQVVESTSKTNDKNDELVSLNVIDHRRPSSSSDGDTGLSASCRSNKPKSSRRTTARRLSLEERMDLLQIGSNSNSQDVEEVMNQMDSIFAASRNKSRSSSSRSSSGSGSSRRLSSSRRPVLRRRSSDYLLTVNGTAA